MEKDQVTQVNAQMLDMADVSIILPAKNEANSLKSLLPKLKAMYNSAEIIVVDDGSDDSTNDICVENEVNFVRHLYSKGNGAAIKTGARHAKGKYLVFMDSDGQHKPADIGRLLEKLNQGYDMIVGCRSDDSQATLGRLAANKIYNHLASWLVGHKITDLTSGFRAVRADKFREYLYLLPNGFSYPTTITMAFFRAGYSVAYEAITAEKRIGDSHIRLLRDGARFFLIIFKIATLYSPLKLFVPVSVILFSLGSTHYLYTYIISSRFTNMSALLFLSSLFVFLMGLMSEQMTALLYKGK